MGLLSFPAIAHADEPPPHAPEPAATPPPTPTPKAPVAAVREGLTRIVVLPTVTVGPDGAARAPTPAEGRLFEKAQELDATLRDGVQDLGFTMGVGDSDEGPPKVSELEILERASQPPGTSPETRGTWVVSARLERVAPQKPREPGEFLVRVVVVPPGGRELHVRIARARASDVSARGLVLLRELLSSSSATQLAKESDPEKSKPHEEVRPPPATRNSGRGILAVSGAAFGAFTAYGLQRASGSDDPRVLYPLLALGTGVGLGSALIASAEWDVSTGDAYYLTAGAGWGVFAGLALASGTNVQPLSDRYAYGVAGGLSGLALSVIPLIRTRIDEGGAILAHSGGGLGAFFGGMAEAFARGTIDTSPGIGLGIGAAAGVAAMGTTAIFVKVAPTRALVVDLGAGLGALGGAALSSPLIFENVTPNKARGFIAATTAGAIAGGVTAFLLTRDRAPSASSLHVMPNIGVIGASDTKQGPVPAYGGGFVGVF